VHSFPPLIRALPPHFLSPNHGEYWFPFDVGSSFLSAILLEKSFPFLVVLQGIPPLTSGPLLPFCAVSIRNRAPSALPQASPTPNVRFSPLPCRSPANACSQTHARSLFVGISSYLLHSIATPPLFPKTRPYQSTLAPPLPTPLGLSQRRNTRDGPFKEASAPSRSRCVSRKTRPR